MVQSLGFSMNRRAEIPESLLVKTRISPKRIEYFEEADESIIEDIRLGVLLVMAFWSVYSVKAFVKLTEVLAQFDPDERLRFVVVNTDGSPALYEKAEFLGRMSGAGETVWVKEGKIVSTSGLGFNPDCFESNTLSLLVPRSL
jgi:hypothetical protein